jgi:hypothetical protein
MRLSTTRRTWRFRRRWATGRGREGRAYGNIGKCLTHLNEFVKAVAYYEAKHTLATEIGLAHTQAHAALGVGMALAL